MKIAAGEGPLERRGSPLIVALEGEETLFEFGQGSEVVWRENLSLDNGEIDLHLIEPTGVDRRVDENGIGPFVMQTVGGFLAPVSGAVVHDPKDPTSGLVGLLAHDLGERADPRELFRFSLRSDRRPLRDGRPMRPGRSRHLRGSIRARRALGGSVPASASAVCGGALECWSFRRRR